MAEIEARNLSKTFGRVAALRELSLSVREGELLALVGPSGCGKTTLLRIIAGLDSADRSPGADILIGGRSVLGAPAEKRGVAMVFQSGALFPHLTVERNLRIGAPKGGGVDIGTVASRVGLDGLLRRRPHELSGGQRQRAALARALVSGARAILLDEPLASLDPPARRALRVEIRRVLGELAADAACLHVTHDQEEAMAIGDRVAVMRDGRLEQVGTPEEVYGRPATRFVAAFMGDGMNFVQGALPGVNGAQMGAILAFRPSAMVRDDAGALRLSVESVERLGYETRVMGRLSTEGDDAVAARFVGDAARGIDVGARVGVRIDPGAVHTFGEDGRRIDA